MQRKFEAEVKKFGGLLQDFSAEGRYHFCVVMKNQADRVSWTTAMLEQSVVKFDDRNRQKLAAL